METLNTVAIDITESVFENESAAMLYITKDIYSDSYIIAIPVESFSYQVWFSDIERDLNDLLRYASFGHRGQRERLIAAIKEGIVAIEN